MSLAPVAASVLLALAAGCVEEPALDIDHMTIRVNWVKGQRNVAVSLPDLPCVGTKRGFLGEEGVECNSAPWTLSVDGTAFATTPMQCTAAHDGWFGRVDEDCSGGSASAALPDAAGEDVELVASTGDKRAHRVLRGVRRTYAWTEQAPLDSSHPGLVRVEGSVQLGFGPFAASFTRPDGAPARGSARRSTTDLAELELSLDAGSRIPGAYAAHVEAYVRQDDATIAVPIDGTLTVAE